MKQTNGAAHAVSLGIEAVWPRAFAAVSEAGGARAGVGSEAAGALRAEGAGIERTDTAAEWADEYLKYPQIRKLIAFFEAKGLAAIKEEDRREQWYGDWLKYQSAEGLYASVLSPARFSSRGAKLDLLQLVRFVEVFAYYSPAHAYSFQVSFLGLISILTGSNDALKQEAVARLEAGELLAFGVSEKQHGADLFGNEFTIWETEPGQYAASGSKYYVGNANAAAIISVLARKGNVSAAGPRRAPFVLFALRPGNSVAFRNLKKIHTSGVRAGYVGSFEVKEYAFGDADLIAEGRNAWDAVFGAVTMGKFLLGFGSVGICEHALAEAVAHLSGRILYGKPAIELPHLRSISAQAYARLMGMKLFAYRALDYLHSASAADRRYVLFNAVQKAKVGNEGVKVMDLLSECVGAKGFEAETHFEMARRDAALIPAVEGSTHVNLALAALFVPRYFAPARPEGVEAELEGQASTGLGVTMAGDAGSAKFVESAHPLRKNVRQLLADPPSLAAGEVEPAENDYLMHARTGSFHSIEFAPFLKAYEPLMAVANVRLLSRQAETFSEFINHERGKTLLLPDTETALALGAFLATFAYAQLIAENCIRCAIPQAMVSAIFHGLVGDVSSQAMMLASTPHLDGEGKVAIGKLIVVPETTAAEWDFVAGRVRVKQAESNRSSGG